MIKGKIITNYMGDGEYALAIEGKDYPHIIISNLHDTSINGYIINNSNDEGNYAGVGSKVKTIPMPHTNNKRKAIQIAKNWIKKNWANILEKKK